MNMKVLACSLAVLFSGANARAGGPRTGWSDGTRLDTVVTSSDIDRPLDLAAELRYRTSDWGVNAVSFTSFPPVGFLLFLR